VNRGFAIQVGSLARRSVVRTLRQPASSIPPITFPLALMAVNAAGLDAATEIPKFPTESFLPFALAVPFIQGALFATMNGGTDLARDIQTGFFNRLSLTPMHGTALLVGTLAGVVALGLAQAVIYLLVGVFVADVEIAAGFGGALVLLLLATLIALGFGALGAMMALRTGSGEAVQGLFPALFVFLFISSMNMPRELIEIDWFRIAATVNPVSYLLEGVRSLIIDGWDAQTLALGFGVALAIAAVSLTLAALALRKRMERT
jgi:ABC-2 type transport system permease protein